MDGMRKGVGVGRREGEVGAVVRGVLGLVVDDVSRGRWGRAGRGEKKVLMWCGGGDFLGTDGEKGIVGVFELVPPRTTHRESKHPFSTSSQPPHSLNINSSTHQLIIIHPPTPHAHPHRT